ncbi:MAG: TonB-dependent siderophore receptor [Limnobacter sp.]|uniref:TonB-dependent receptor n=1 Tax=Limnobacter sp. TaxID=2003368 RepID=UPI0032EC3454
MITHNPKLSAVALAVFATLSSTAFAQTAELPAVQVNASADASAEGLAPEYAGGQVATGGRVGLLGTQSNMDTPFNLTSYTSKLIQDQQAASVGEVLLNDPAVRVARGFGNFQQVYLVRGLPIFSDDMSYNGLYGLLPRQYLASELIERVEVLRGASAFLNGAAPGGSGLGGAINVVPKRAPNHDINQATAGIQDGGEAYLAGDFARRFNEGSTGVRATVAKRDGDTSVNGESRELTLFALGADFRRDKLRISADLGYQDHKLQASQPNVTIAAGLAIPAAPRADRSIAQPWTYSNAEDTFATVRAEYDFNNTVTGWLAGGVREGNEAGNFANPTVTNAQGDTNSLRFTNTREDSVQTAEAGLRFKFNTGGVKHTVSTSASVFELESRNAFAFSSFAGFSGNIYNPMPVDEPPANAFLGGDLGNPLVTGKTETSSLAIADTLALLNDQLLVTVGARRQTIESTSFDFNSGAQTDNYSESATTPVAGVVYKINPQYSVYANYIEGLVRGDTAPASANGQAVTNAGQVFKPFKTEQTEIGLKYDGGSVGGSVSVFQSDKPVYGVDSNNTYSQVDDQTNRGLEIMAFGKASKTVTVLGGISFLNTDVDGKDAIGAPQRQANVGVEWSPEQLTGFAFETRALYTSSQYANSANTQEVPSWTRLDMGVRYVMPVGNDQALTLRARLDNVTDRNYWASAGGFPGFGYLTIGNPRTLTVSASLDF